MFDTPALPSAITQIVHHVIVDSIPMDVMDAIEIPKNVLRRIDNDGQYSNDHNHNHSSIVTKPTTCSSYLLCNPYPYPLSMKVTLIEGDSVLNFQKQTSLIKLRCMLSNVKVKKMEKVNVNAKMFVEVNSNTNYSTNILILILID
jgi:hypothetical protein